MKQISTTEAVQLLQYLERLDDTQVQEICELLERQERMIKAACEELGDFQDVREYRNDGIKTWLEWLTEKAGEAI